MKFTSVKMMQLDVQGMVNKICFFLQISTKMLFTIYSFLFKFALSILSIISDMLTSC